MLEKDQIAAALPSYEIGAELGRGGWGVVLAGHHRQLGRDVAIKQLPRAFAADPAVLARFLSEARLLASLDHPHIVPIYDFVETDGLCLLVMEALPGGTLWSRFTTTGITPAAACALVLATAAGLQAAHARNILHRDIKPENLMFSAGGALKVTDFGIAKMVGGEDTMATRAGEVVGTPAYMAPEQAKGTGLSPATDLYAVATMLYELLSGQLPFTDDGDALNLLFKHAYEQPTPLRDQAAFIPPSIADVVMRGLATEPADRYASADSFGEALATGCTDAWGPGWLSAEAIPVLGSGHFLALTEQVTSRAPRPPAGQTTAASAPTPEPAPGPGTVGPSTGPVATSRQTIVRPTSGHRASRNVGIADIGGQELVAVQSVLPAPAPPAAPMLVAAAIALVMVVIAFVGLGRPSTSSSAATVTVQDSVLGLTGSGSTVPLDLSKKIEITGASADADKAELSLQVVGQDVVKDSTPLTGGAGSIDASNSKFLLAGKVIAKLTLLRQGQVLSTTKFRAKLHQPGYLSAPGILDVALLLIIVAYGEALLRALRRGRRGVSGSVGMAIVGALLGPTTVVFAWLFAGREPTGATVAACSAAGALAGVAFGVAGLQIGKRRRYRRRMAAEARATGAMPVRTR